MSARAVHTQNAMAVTIRLPKNGGNKVVPLEYDVCFNMEFLEVMAEVVDIDERLRINHSERVEHYGCEEGLCLSRLAAGIR